MPGSDGYCGEPSWNHNLARRIAEDNEVVGTVAAAVVVAAAIEGYQR